MGDLWYLPNWQTAHCTFWGRAGSCAYVSSRCSVEAHDFSVKVNGPHECTGLSSWAGFSEHVDRKCAFGSHRCRNAYDAVTMGCDAACATGTDDGATATCNATTAVRALHVDHTHDDGGAGLLDDWWGWFVWLILLYSLLSLFLIALYASSGDHVWEY